MSQSNAPIGSTPIDPDEARELLLIHVADREDLNRWEYQNIKEALIWLEKTKPKNILNEKFIRDLHIKMFGQVWKNAGHFRNRDMNIGVSWWQISSYLRNMCEDVNIWIEKRTYTPDETAVRFHQRLVFIHPFTNGNGRLSRLITDILLENLLEEKRFTWGGGVDLIHKSKMRKVYIRALKEADKFNFEPLINFVRS
ncbi:MAG: mobile mystery protein B [Thermodesulfobacteriota bacterium]